MKADQFGGRREYFEKKNKQTNITSEQAKYKKNSEMKKAIKKKKIEEKIDR